jgi:hypothetical protein
MIAAAILLPSPAAFTIDAGPWVPTSPPAKIPGIDVSKLSGSVLR